MRILLDECIDRRLAKEIAIAVILLQAPTNRLKDLRPLLPKLQRLLQTAPKREVSRVSL